MGDKTHKNLYEAFVGEAKAHRRLLAFARKAEEEGYPQVAKLFRAVSAAEGVHADNHLRLLGEAVVRDTQANLDFSFETEKTVNGVYYPQFIKEAEEEGSRAAARSFSQARDVEEGHAKLYEKALRHLLRDEDADYYVCRICGYVSDGVLPEVCPVCGAKKELFYRTG
ncbi:MAG: rubrerythrin family protein [Anaerolineales bacterium]|nr:MAG: rubrerythrin family protein [Anaerolineales bacterium]